MRSRLSGLASYSAGTGRTGRRFAYRPIPLRRPSRPCSGRGASGSVVSHFGPPTAASSTASAALQAASVSSLQRGAVDVDRGAPEEVLVEAEVLGDRAQELERGRHDLRADPVAGQGDDGGHSRAGYGFRRRSRRLAATSRARRRRGRAARRRAGLGCRRRRGRPLLCGCGGSTTTTARVPAASQCSALASTSVRRSLGDTTSTARSGGPGQWILGIPAGGIRALATKATSGARTVSGSEASLKPVSAAKTMPRRS